MCRRLRLFRTAALWGLLSALSLNVYASTGSPLHWTYIDANGEVHAFAEAEACDNVIDGGQVGSDVKGCPNPTFQTPTLSSITLPSGGSGDLEFLWMQTSSDPAGAQPVSWKIIPGSTSPEYTPQPLTTTTYFMRCARRSGCTTFGGESNYVTVTVDCCDNATDGGTISGDQTACGVPYDPSLIINSSPATGGSNAMQYAWYASTSSDAYTIGSADWNLVNGVSTPYYNPEAISEPTYYVRTAKREFCAEIGSFSNVIYVNAQRLPGLKADTTAVTCFGDSDGAVTVTVLNAAEPFTYRWLDGAATTLTRTNLSAGDYGFEISDANGCVATLSVTVGTPAELSAVINAEFDACNFQDDAVLTATVSGGTPPFTYAWNGGETTAAISNQAAGTYSVDITDANGCAISADFTLAPQTMLTTTVSSTQPNCYQPDGTINVAPQGGTAPYTYVWSHDAAETSANLIGLSGGLYDVTTTDANGCEVSNSFTLDDTAPITVALDADDVTCNGAADSEIISTVNGGIAPYTYLWNDGSTSTTFTGAGPGTYELVVTDANNCEQRAEITLSQPDALVATIDVQQPVCREDGGELTAMISGGTPPYNFDWGTEGRTNEQTLTGLAAGTYTLNATDAGGCTFSVDARIDDVALLELAIAHTDATCPGETDGTATVSPSGGQPGYTYLWSDDAAQTTATATNLSAGVYTAQVSDARGCIKTLSVEVENESTGPQIDADTTDVNCFGGSTASIDLTITEGLPPYSFEWSRNGTLEPAVTSEDRTGLSAGTYEVLVTDAAGCSATSTFTFEDPEALSARITQTSSYATYFNVSAYGAIDGSASVAVEGGAAPYTYAWTQDGSAVAAGADANMLSGGIVSVVVTDAKGCVFTHDTLMVEPSMISDFVWVDENGDGIQDPLEPGLAGVSITLTGTDFMGASVNFTANSDADGAYKFDVLPKGEYALSFDLPNFQDYLFSPVDQGGDDALDSDMDPVSLSINRDVLEHGVGDFDTDAGFIPRTSVVRISDRAWYDANHNGIQDRYEVDVQGVILTLFRSTDSLFQDQVVTNEDGKYAFSDVVPGRYYITVDPGSPALASGYELTEANSGVNDEDDSDFDPITWTSDEIIVTATTEDITNVDLGLHASCEEVDTPGVIAGNETVCRGEVSAPVTSSSTPAGAIEYKWLRSSTTLYEGSNDPNWTQIPGATAPEYQPSGIVSTVHYLRLAAVQGCDDFTGTSNVVTKTVNPLPPVALASIPRNMCLSEPFTFTADSTAPVVYEWDFGIYADQRYATGRTIPDVTFNTHSVSFNVVVNVTDANGCVGGDSSRVFTRNCFGPGTVDDFGAETTPQLGTNLLRWTAFSAYAGSAFDVERNVAGRGFAAIATVQARNLGDMVDYEYADKFAPSGEVSYRVVHRAPSMEAIASHEATLTSEQVALMTRTYPNPVEDMLTFEVAAAQLGAVSYQLLNAYGATVAEGAAAAGAHRLDMATLPSGTYYLKAITEQGDSEVRTIVKH